MDFKAQLQEMRNYGGKPLTVGLAEEVVHQLAEQFPDLTQAVADAYAQHQQLRSSHDELLRQDETDIINQLQAGYVNFYADDAVNPYVTLAARGPWIVTIKGAILHDSGGYGMLGLGHAPEVVLNAMNQPHVMANVMSPSFSQLRLVELLRQEIGQTRGGCPFEKFLCINSGSESVTVAARIADINARTLTDEGARHAGKTIRKLSLRGGFHGRTDRPAQFSDSTRSTYGKYLASFRDSDTLLTVEPNNVEELQQIFDDANANNVFIEAFFMEPVMGEGNPGEAITPEFYALARKLTAEHGSLFLVDSIQAGLRTQGVLSICDYPGFSDLPAPDMETYSKALNAGQYPLSVLAMSAEAAALYRKGVYGNTMTTNPRALDVACSVLENMSDELRQNIRDRGQEFVDKLNQLKEELGGRITKVQGTGLLFSAELDSERYKGYGENSIEEYLRKHGINVIHGGENSLRYTPYFGITSAEVDLIVAATRDALLNGPMKATADKAA
ncbi:MAG: aminotransferase class III-fold pyridoxal phosphate-dependent enzyme [Xanthomonadales bacterium]|jgi:acetylornithine/succinyldiaminopimelate/putrescine aminotransferase|nr:aminotransferase class III-fold pyridoxal phosphate-dependent enzyme [Xanthomonadales bacterium]